MRSWVLFIYAPTKARQRVIFWTQIVDVLPHVDTWIVGADFNNVEWIHDVRLADGQMPRVTSIAPSEGFLRCFLIRLVYWECFDVTSFCPYPAISGLLIGFSHTEWSPT